MWSLAAGLLVLVLLSQDAWCALPASLATGGACPPPFTKIGDECFYLSDVKKNWNDARRRCQDMGGDLAVPSDVPALDAYVFGKVEGPGVWIGGTDQYNEGVWNYINGDPIKAQDWSETQPDNYGGGEDCLEIRSYFDPPVNDYICSVEQHFVCEIGIVPEISCPKPFIRIGKECFHLSTTALAWNAARRQCKLMGSDLAVPSDVPALDAYVFAKTKGPGVWIGGTDQYNEGVWNYINGDPIKAQDWSETQPDNYGGGEDCLEIRSYFDPPVNDYICSVEQHYVCEIQV